MKRDAGWWPTPNPFLRPAAEESEGTPPAEREDVAARRAIALYLAPTVFFVALAGLTLYEIRTSRLQAFLFHQAAKDFEFETAAGAAEEIQFPTAGPWDRRFGYAELPRFAERLEGAGYVVTEQARQSESMRRWAERGVHPIYWEKSQAGLEIRGPRGATAYHARRPERVYAEFSEIPPIVVDSLRFIENREMLDPQGSAYYNPAVEWVRLSRAVYDLAVSKITPGYPVSGGSTLATQLEKLRHSEDGRTSGVGEKLRQMLAASFRAYQDGQMTREAQERIFTTYLNSIPLSGVAGFGEVDGLRDGLWAWYGSDPAKADALLASDEAALTDAEFEDRATYYRQALSLMLALKRPTELLAYDNAALNRRVNAFLRMLARDGVISPRLRDAALARGSTPTRRAPARPELKFAERKAIDGVRASLASLLDVDGLYGLDRLDLEVETAIDSAANHAVTERLLGLSDPEAAAEAGLASHRLLASGDPAEVVYSFTLYERGPGGNRLRVQADTWDQPFNINAGAKLELGSTAKLRTLTSYLRIISGLHEDLRGRSDSELAGMEIDPEDRLRLWAVEWMRERPDGSLSEIIEDAMLRTYSASPGERFFTGGGLHRFSNFEGKDNGRVMTVREGFQRSVNLVFVRLMRDVVRFHLHSEPGVRETLEDGDHPRREEYLRRFADMEGRQFMADFYREHKDLTPRESWRAMLGKREPTPKRVAALRRWLAPAEEFVEFARFMRGALPDWRLSEETLTGLYDRYDPDAFDLQDRGYLAKVHPLEIWLAGYLAYHPEAGWDEIVEASAAARQESYRWLFETSRKHAQDKRIRVIMETDAFSRLHEDWTSLGYPFDELVPSYATALGSSGDRPEALAELVGIILNGGVRYPARSIESLRFAAGTPYETLFERRRDPGRRVLQPETAARLREEMRGVVEKGTGRRAFGVIELADGTRPAIGGKTGTGDNRFETYDRGGRALDSRVVNRTGTFVFYIGDRYFGVVTAFVDGSKAKNYNFTSALPAQVFRVLGPRLVPLLES